jgi:hypothetical protein
MLCAIKMLSLPLSLLKCGGDYCKIFGMNMHEINGGTHMINSIFQRIEDGQLSAKQAMEIVNSSSGITNLEGFARIDEDRELRCGVPEVVFGAGKTVEQAVRIFGHIYEKSGRALATRINSEMAEELQNRWSEGIYNKEAGCFYISKDEDTQKDNVNRVYSGLCMVVSAGTSDIPVAEEACETLRYIGCNFEKIYDVGVAGLHRLLAEVERISAADVIIVVAGMEGALPSVVGGLVSSAVIAVPTSVGYGSSFGGVSALLGMLNSCASGVGVVNIDNGFGAAVLASKVLMRRDVNV